MYIATNSTGSITLPGSYAQYYVRFAWYIASNSTLHYFRSLSDATNMHFVQTNADRSLSIGTGASTVVATTAAGIFNLAEWFVVELYGDIADSGTLTLKLGGAVVATYSGDTKPSTQTTINTLTWKAISSSAAYVDDLAVNDTTGAVDNSWCGDGHIIALVPNAAGTTTQWTPSTGDNYTCVDEVPSNDDTDYVSTTSADQIDLYNLTTSDLLTGATINRVWIETNAKKATADATDIHTVLRPASTNYASDGLLLTTSYLPVRSAEYLTNPDDSEAWEKSDIDSLQVGIKS